MNTGSCIGIYNMKPHCRILAGGRNSSIFGFQFPKRNQVITDNLSTSISNLNDVRRIHGYGNRIIGFKSVIIPNRTSFFRSDSNLGQSKVFSGCPIDRCNHRFVLGIVNVASDFRNHSTSAEPHLNKNQFEEIYIRGGLALEPFLIEKIDKAREDKVTDDEINVHGSNVNIDYTNKELDDPQISKSPRKREVSEVEKEAWKLLREAVVNYCGQPVGTVAANDPADKLPLNYDQVFIRDFVPSALAFLLNGEGEIVKNFLLHTLQLQVVMQQN